MKHEELARSLIFCIGTTIALAFGWYEASVERDIPTRVGIAIIFTVILWWLEKVTFHRLVKLFHPGRGWEGTWLDITWVENASRSLRYRRLASILTIRIKDDGELSLKGDLYGFGEHGELTRLQKSYSSLSAYIWDDRLIYRYEGHQGYTGLAELKFSDNANGYNGYFSERQIDGSLGLVGCAATRIPAHYQSEDLKTALDALTKDGDMRLCRPFEGIWVEVTWTENNKGGRIFRSLASVRITFDGSYHMKVTHFRGSNPTFDATFAGLSGGSLFYEYAAAWGQSGLGVLKTEGLSSDGRRTYSGYFHAPKEMAKCEGEEVENENLQTLLPRGQDLARRLGIAIPDAPALGGLVN